MTTIEEFTSQYGLVKKIDAFGFMKYLHDNPDAPRKHGKVVLVTADTPLKASRGEGKTTTTIALIDALRVRGIDAAAVLRQPSMGITAAGSKGGASGGGKASLTHPELIDWGLCGEMAAIAAAQNLLVSFAEKAVDEGRIDTILVPRVSEVPSRSLRSITVDAGKNNVAEKVVLTPTSELMQIVVLSRSMDEIGERVAAMIAGTKDGEPVKFGDFIDLWRITDMLADAVKPARDGERLAGVCAWRPVRQRVDRHPDAGLRGAGVRPARCGHRRGRLRHRRRSAEVARHRLPRVWRAVAVRGGRRDPRLDVA